MDGQIAITAPKTIPDLDRLLDTVLERSLLHTSYIHGDPHWRAVAEVGLRLLDDQRGADRMVVFLFALFHDAMRVNEVEDPGHGQRGAELAAELHGRYFQLAPDRFGLLFDACAGHTDVRFSDDPTIGVCVDADRLNLWRVGNVPEAKFLSTDAAIEDDLQHWSKSLHGYARDWAELLQAYSS
ncbi:MAG: uncharacterized protein QOJ29_513 [Thermoleophilaceae bacterium]|nr:uncharacterized protein [Thermoleophilaceae bacterium]